MSGKHQLTGQQSVRLPEREVHFGFYSRLDEARISIPQLSASPLVKEDTHNGNVKVTAVRLSAARAAVHDLSVRAGPEARRVVLSTKGTDYIAASGSNGPINLRAEDFCPTPQWSGRHQPLFIQLWQWGISLLFKDAFFFNRGSASLGEEGSKKRTAIETIAKPNWPSLQRENLLSFIFLLHFCC